MRIHLAITLFLSLVFAGCNPIDTAISDLPNCEDGILNNGEREIDCGGKSCSPCAARMNADIDGSPWKLFGPNITSQINGNSIFISGMDSLFRSISLIHTGDFAPGSYPLSGGLFSNSANTYTASTGTINISEWDTTERYISGYFSFKAFTGSGDSVTVSNGNFSFAPY
ncbi:MAG: DUF6252 family protein [Bacteroidota bacterium]